MNGKYPEVPVVGCVAGSNVRSYTQLSLLPLSGFLLNIFKSAGAGGISGIFEPTLPAGLARPVRLNQDLLLSSRTFPCQYHLFAGDFLDGPVRSFMHFPHFLGTYRFRIFSGGGRLSRPRPQRHPGLYLGFPPRKWSKINLQGPTDNFLDYFD